MGVLVSGSSCCHVTLVTICLVLWATSVSFYSSWARSINLTPGLGWPGQKLCVFNSVTLAQTLFRVALSSFASWQFLDGLLHSFHCISSHLFDCMLSSLAILGDKMVSTCLVVMEAAIFWVYFLVSPKILVNAGVLFTKHSLWYSHIWYLMPTANLVLTAFVFISPYTVY